MIGYATFIRVGVISSSNGNSIKTVAKAQIGKVIRDFDCNILDSK